MKLYKLTVHVDILPEFYWVVATDPTTGVRVFLDKMKSLNRTYFKEKDIKNIEVVAIDNLIIQ